MRWRVLRKKIAPCRVSRDPETAEVLISGIGESHLQITLEGIKRKYGVDLEARDPRVSYRETIRKKARANGRHKRQSGGHGQFGDVWLEIEPLPMGGEENFVFEDKIVGGVVPGQYIPGVEKGVRDSLKRGFISGNPMVYVKVALVDGKYHPVDSSAQSFEIAASLGMQEAVPIANPTILEPVMTTTITVPESYMGDIMSDINTKRGRVLGHAIAGQWAAANHRQCAAGRNAALRHRPALDHAGARLLQDGVLPVRGGTREYPAGNYREAQEGARS